LDNQGRLTFFNDMAGSWLGLQPEDLGRTANSLETLTMTDGNFWNRVLESQTIQRFEEKRKRSLMSANSHSQPSLDTDEEAQAVSISVAPMKNGPHEKHHYILVLNDVNHIPRMAADVMVRITKLREQQAEIERNIAEARAAELQTRARIERLKSLESEARERGFPARRLEDEMTAERDRFRNEKTQMQNSLQQLLNTNKLKSEFIVHCGRELESSVQATMGIAELLDNEAYGALTPRQREAVRELLRSGNRIKDDIESLIAYGAARL
jgi:signal transduction histidine kinase